jgi:hypothetical protein
LAPAMLYNNVVALNYFYSVFGSFIKIYWRPYDGLKPLVNYVTQC